MKLEVVEMWMKLVGVEGVARCGVLAERWQLEEAVTRGNGRTETQAGYKSNLI